MVVPEVPPRVKAFVADHLRSLEDLQLLILLMQSGERWWDAESVARELLTPLRGARLALDHLASHNLLDIRITGDVRYQFRPGTEELRAGAEACFDAYRTAPLAVTTLVTGSTRRGFRDFADAFRIRKDEDDDR